MSLEKKGKFWVASVEGRVMYRSRVRPHGEQLAHLLLGDKPVTVGRYTQETFDEKFPDDASIKEILLSLNPTVDEHWTKRGLPSMSYIEGQLGDTSITRKDVSKAMPGLKRK